MPLKKGYSKRTMAANFHELRHGEQYARTRRKFGKETANKQMVAIVLKIARETRRKRNRARRGRRR